MNDVGQTDIRNPFLQFIQNKKHPMWTSNLASWDVFKVLAEPVLCFGSL